MENGKYAEQSRLAWEMVKPVGRAKLTELTNPIALFSMHFLQSLQGDFLGEGAQEE